MGSGREQVHRRNDGFIFLSREARNNLPNYVYKGEDRSLLYIYILSPLALFLVNHCTPSYIAPNTITLVGLAFMITSYGLFWVYAPTLSEDNIPSQIFLYHAIAMLIYQTLDNMDGKQARRTKSSSPLGLLFDHGCDAMNSLFGSTGWILGLGLLPQTHTLQILALVLGPYAMFYIATWEEYHTGELILPIINGPNEGIVGGAALSLVTCYYGTEFWQSTSFYDTAISLVGDGWFKAWVPPISNADLQVLVAVSGIIREVTSKSWYVVQKHGSKSLILQLPLWILMLTIGCLNYATTDGATTLMRRMPRTMLHLSSGLFCESVTQLMLNHISHTRFSVSGRLLLFLPLLPIVCMTPPALSDTMLLGYTIMLWIYLMYKVQRVVHEMCLALNISCFDISTQQRQGGAALKAE